MGRPLLRLALCVSLLASSAAAGDPPAPISTFEPGPYSVGSWDWDFGQVMMPLPGSGGPVPVDHFGTLRYPALKDGVLTPMAPGMPFPFVVFAHGRYHVAPFIGSNHLQASYLLDHLASHGFVVASVNLDVVGQFGSPAAISHRGNLIHFTIDAFKALDPAGRQYDFTRTALVGHSRGGEGAVNAFVRQELLGNAIFAVASISPTDFQKNAMDGAPYLSLYGSKDGDVNNGWPIFVYDRATGARKAFEYIEGANHFWFTDSIHFSGEGNGKISREQHHDIARTYITAFLISQVTGVPRSFANLEDGPSLFPVTDDAVIHPMYSEPGAQVLNDFEDLPEDTNTNSAGAASLAWLLSALDEQGLSNSGMTFFHKTRGLQVAYDTSSAGNAFYAERIPHPGDVTRFSHLSLRVLQHVTSPLNTAGQAQDATVVLVDRAGRQANVRISEHGTIPWPILHAGSAFPSKSVLRTTRIPLEAFATDNPEIDLTSLMFVGFAFDQNASADLRLDDIVFTN